MKGPRNEPATQAGLSNSVGMLLRSRGWFIGLIVILAAATVGVWIFTVFNAVKIDDNNSDLSDKISALDDSTSQELARMQKQLNKQQKEIDELTKRVDRTSNCTVCDDVFVTQTVFNSTVEEILDELGNCTDCVQSETFEAFVNETDASIDTINGKIADLQNNASSIASGNDYVRGQGFIGAINETALDLQFKAANYWTMSSRIQCEDPGRSYEQTATEYLTLDFLDRVGYCNETGEQTLFNNTDGTISFCPCTSGYYDVSMSLQNLYVVRTSRNKYLTTTTRGAAISFGFNYVGPDAGGEPYYFNGGVWPIPPVYTFTWDADQSQSLPYYFIPDTIQNDYPDFYTNENVPFNVVSFSGSRLVYFSTDPPGGYGPSACYNLAMQVYDPFQAPDDLCSNTYTQFASVDYTFFGPPFNSSLNRQYLFGSFSIQKVAWTSPMPPNEYYADLRPPYIKP